MPIFEGSCRSSTCRSAGRPQEHYYHNSDQPMAPCDVCGGPTERVMSRFGIVWTGPISAKYLDRSKEGGQKMDGAHWAYENSGTPGKNATPVRIETWDDQRAFCKRNGLARPQEMSNHYEVAEDGKTVKNSVGLPGCEI